MSKIRTKKLVFFYDKYIIQPLWLTHFIEILLVPEFQLIEFIVGAFSYKAHFRPQISSSEAFFNASKVSCAVSSHTNGVSCFSRRMKPLVIWA